MGWEVYPKGLKKVLNYASVLNIPIIITEMVLPPITIIKNEIH